MSNKKTVIITGGNSGLGFECARNIALASPGCRVILACRDMAKAEQAKNRIIKESGNPDIQAMELDVSSIASVRAFAGRYKEQNTHPLYGLVCNAGVNGTYTGKTGDGFDVVFETNHLGHFLLTGLLLPLMLPRGRIAVVSSDMHSPPGTELFWPGTAALAYPDEQLGSSSVRYSFSKLCNLSFTYELSRRLSRTGSNITVNAFNPGLMTDTNFSPDKSRYTPAFMEKISDRLGSLEQSGQALADLITEPDLAGTTAAYFDRGIARKESSPLSYNKAHTLDLWNMSVMYAGLAKDETLPGLL